jgi:Zn-dependent M28 family amino/carboxypeptidase
MKRAAQIFQIGFLALLISATTSAQTLPFFTEQQYKYLVNEISGDAAYEHLRFTTQFHKPDGGTPGLMEVAKYVESKAKEYGLTDVKLIKQAHTSPAWEAKRAELWMVEPDIQLLGSLNQTQLHIADYSRSADVTTEVIDVGSGLTDKDYEGKNVSGKIVFAWGNTSAVMNQAVWKRGAVGIIHHPDPNAVDYPLNTVSHPDQIRWSRVPQQSTDGKPATFAFVLSHRQAVAFRNVLANSKTPVKVHAVVEANFDTNDKWQVMVEGFIRGDVQDQDVVLTGHMQEEKFSANDDGSGVANTLEIARALTKLIKEGRLPKPKRNIRFWWVTEISSQRQYFADNPNEASKILCNVNQDMVGANQAQDLMRVQNVTRLPFSRWHWLNDVVETVVEFVVKSNSIQLSELSQVEAKPYPKPILSRLGSRHRYNAAMVPYHTSTDHMTFLEAPIGKPGVTFTNWPDNYIHTSDDDLWNIDRTQLQRNAFAVAAIGFTVANADEKSLPVIANELYGRAMMRLSEDFKVASTLLATASDGNKVARYKQALNQIQEAQKREEMAIDALVQITKAARPLMSELRDGLKRTADGYVLNLRSRYLVLYNEANPNQLPLTAKETELLGFVPQLAAGPQEFLTKRNQIKGVAKLNSLMALEVLNFIDGKRNGLDIYNAVSAEALRAGETYYGTVTPEMVAEYLQNLEAASLIKLQKK